MLRKLPDADIERLTGGMCRDHHDYETDTCLFAKTRREAFALAANKTG